VVEVRQPHFRGGASEPLSRQDIEAKFRLNVKHGGWKDRDGENALALLGRLFQSKMDLTGLRQ
jgi:hypothetical protein